MYQEANPKPDLARPTAKATSIIGQGIASLGWSYEDLVAFLLVERLATLQRTRPFAVAHIVPADVAPSHMLRMLPHKVKLAISPSSSRDALTDDDIGSLDDDEDGDAAAAAQEEEKALRAALPLWAADEDGDALPVMQSSFRTASISLSACAMEALRVPWIRTTSDMQHLQQFQA